MLLKNEQLFKVTLRLLMFMPSIFPSIYDCNSTLCEQFCQNLYKGVKGMLGLYDLAFIRVHETSVQIDFVCAGVGALYLCSFCYAS